MRVRVLLTLSALVLVAIPAAASADDGVRTITLNPANNTGQRLTEQTVDASATSDLLGAIPPYENGTRGKYEWASYCGPVCPLWAEVQVADADGDPSFGVTAHNPLAGSNSASCSVVAPWRCDISYNRSGIDLNVNTNVYWSGYGAAPKPQVHVGAPALVSSRAALRRGLPLRVGASRVGTVTTTLTRVGTRAAAARHGRSVKQIAVGGPDHAARLRLNRRGRAAVRRADVVRYRLRSVFRDQDGKTATRTRRLTVVTP